MNKAGHDKAGLAATRFGPDRVLAFNARHMSAGDETLRAGSNRPGCHKMVIGT